MKLILFYNEILIDNQDPFRKIQNDQTAMAVDEDGRNNEETQGNSKSVLPSFMSTLLHVDENSDKIISLNIKHCAVIYVVQE